MINLLEGTPGGGKSYEALVYHILPTLRSGRKVVTNLPLIRDAFEFLYPELMPLLDIRTENLPILGRWDAEAANRGERAFIVGEFDVDERYDLPILHDGRPYLPPQPAADFLALSGTFMTNGAEKAISARFTSLTNVTFHSQNLALVAVVVELQMK